MLLLGYFSAHGLGVEQSDSKAFYWFKRAVAKDPTDAFIVNEVAWTLSVTKMKNPKRIRFATRAMNKLMRKNQEALSEPAYLDTWAATYAAKGDFQRAISIQEKAINLIQDTEILPVLKSHLDLFRNREAILEKIR